jgi:hypothetical protein
MLWTVGGITTAWWVVSSMVPFTFCYPIQKDVNPLLPGHCDEATPWYTGAAFISAFLDLVVLLIPMPMIWRMQMSLQGGPCRAGSIFLSWEGLVELFLSF